jgi:hypothetical protein
MMHCLVLSVNAWGSVLLAVSRSSLPSRARSEGGEEHVSCRSVCENAVRNMQNQVNLAAAWRPAEIMNTHDCMEVLHLHKAMKASSEHKRSM